MKKALSIFLDIVLYGMMLFLVVGASYIHGLMGFFMAIGYIVTTIAFIVLAMTIVTFFKGGKVAVKEMWGVESN